MSICSSFLLASWPYLVESKTQVSREGIDIEIILDLSLSMLAEDMKPNRLEVAKKSVIEFINETYSDRIGLILFSWKPFHSVPLNYDYDFLRYFISEIQSDTIDKNISELWGTAIWDSLILWVDILSKNQSKREKIILLITDWVANTGVNPDLAKKYASEKGVRVYTIGIGKDENAFVRVPWNFWTTNIVKVWSVDEESLKDIAQTTWWKYFGAEDSSALENILSDIWKLEKTPLVMERVSYNVPVKKELLAILLLLQLGLGYMLYIKKFRI